MPSPHWTPELRERWQTLLAWPLEGPSSGADDSGALDLRPGLMRELGWSAQQTAAAIAEYRRFCLIARALGETGLAALSPSESVDAVWHAHLLHSRDYFERFCPQVLGFRLHHAPARNGSGARLAEAYAQTLAAYAELFGPPPLREWPGSGERFRQARRRRMIDLDRVWLLPRPRWPSANRAAWATTAGALGLLVALVSAPAQAALGPLEWRGPVFLAFYSALAVTAFGCSLWLRRQLRDTGPARGAAADSLSLALLAGAEPRAADTAVAELLQTGVLTLDARGQLQRADAPLPEHEPLRSLALQAERVPDPARFVRKAQPLLRALRAPLLRSGLLLDAEQAWQLRWKSSLPLFVVLLFGLAKVGIGLARERPVALLILLCALTAVAALVLLMKSPLRSCAGDEELRQQRARNAHRLRAPRAEDIGFAVALLGSTALVGTAWAGYHTARQPSGSADGGSGGDSSASGGDAGGGCGGCGGD